MLGTVFLLILSPFSLWLFYWYYKRRYFERYLKTVPGPSPLPLFGNGLELKSSTIILPKLMEYYDKYKTNFVLYLGSQAYIFITEPKDLEFFLGSSTMLTKSDSYNFMHNWLGRGLLTSGKDTWRKHRKLITPAFHFQILEEFIEVFEAQSKILCTKLEKELGKSSVDIYPYIARCTLDSICETAMGTSVNTQDHHDSEYMKSVQTLLQLITERAFSPILSNNLLYVFTETYRREKRALNVVQNYTKSVIASRKKEFFSTIRNNEESVDALGRKKRRAFLDLLLEYSTRDPDFTDEDMRQEVDTIMFAGHDTTATSITFALLALAKHPEVQDRVYEEISGIFSDDPERSVTHKDLQEMKYLEMAIKESMRIYTTVPTVGREIEEEVQWNGITLPKGVMVEAFMYATHHSPNIYPDPEKFDPERFNFENTKARHPYGFVPFSAGPRNCIGQKYAMLEMKAILSQILRTFEVLPPVPDHQIILTNDSVLKSQNGVYIGIRKRSQ